MVEGDLPIIIRQARHHNLQGVDVDLPRRALIVFTGPSGSGKSTLAVDTIFAEARRRYLDCLSTQARQTQLQPTKPAVESITGLPPALCVEQMHPPASCRALVGTISEVLDYLRILFAAAGVPHDPQTGERLVRMTVDEIVAAILVHPVGSKLTLVSPLRGAACQSVVAPGVEDWCALLGEYLRQGFLRVRCGGELHDIQEIITGQSNKNAKPMAWDDMVLVVDRIVLKGEASSSRVADSVQTALRVCADEVQTMVQLPDGDSMIEQEFTYRTRYHNPESGLVLVDVSPMYFSYNSPSGMCPDCRGAGVVRGTTCSACHGARLNAIALNVRLQTADREWSIHELGELPLDELASVLIDVALPVAYAEPLSRLVADLRKRVLCLVRLGLGYLSLNRPATTLSGGELQRVRLAGQLGGGLSGVLYILDEPTAGLHHSDTDKLITALLELRDLGNTVLVIEHDEQVIRAADYVVDMGPGAGSNGGNIVAAGTLPEIMAHESSLTGAWLRGDRKMPEPQKMSVANLPQMELSGCNLHNLRGVDVSIPVGAFVCVAGPSGSGKSTLVHDCLYPALVMAKSPKRRARSVLHKHWGELRGAEKIGRVLMIDQASIGTTPRSTPATYSGLMQELRSLYVRLPLSKQRGYKAARFSTNVRGGRCERCLGMGWIELDLALVSNSLVLCDACQGRRYNRETLEVTWRGKSIADVVAMTVDDAIDFLAHQPKLARVLRAMQSVGLGYLQLDRAAHTLSGGEAQRLKIATELAKVPVGPSKMLHAAQEQAVIILDEPTTGLHFEDVACLLNALLALRDVGHTVVCIEHHPAILQAADVLITMGPGAGRNGGQILR